MCRRCIMSNLYYASAYKNKIINLLLANKNFIKLINPTPSECEELDIIDVLIGGEWIIDGKKWEEQGHIFDYNFANDTTTDQKTFVFVETDIPTITHNLFIEFNLYICIFTSKDLVRLTNETKPTVKEVKNMGYFAGSIGNRVDILCDAVDKILNGNEKIQGIGTLKPSSRGFCTNYSPNSTYYGKCLKYNITNINESDFNNCGN